MHNVEPKEKKKEEKKTQNPMSPTKPQPEEMQADANVDS